MERRQGPYGKGPWVPPRKELALCLKAAGRYGMFWGRDGGVPAVCGAILYVQMYGNSWLLQGLVSKGDTLKQVL